MKNSPDFTIIIPTFNSAPSLVATLQSIFDQNLANYEIIAVDAGSTDHTLEILGTHQGIVRISSIVHYNLYEMINCGIGLAQGQYINVLYPGDFYVHHHTLLDIFELAKQEQFPHLVYCAALLRQRESGVKFLYRHLNLDLLRKGQQPTTLQACWIKKEVFDLIGKFSVQYGLRGGLEFFCRFCLMHKFRVVSLRRALMEYDLQFITSRQVWDHFRETFKIIYRYFGWIAVLRWLAHQKDCKRLWVLWKRRMKFAFFGE